MKRDAANQKTRHLAGKRQSSEMKSCFVLGPLSPRRWYSNFSKGGWSDLMLPTDQEHLTVAGQCRTRLIDEASLRHHRASPIVRRASERLAHLCHDLFSYASEYSTVAGINKKGSRSLLNLITALTT